MNPTAPPPPPQTQPPQPPQPALQPHRPSTSCERHPEENFTGFCPSCLCERLAVLDPNASNPSSSSSARKSSASALKSIFRPPASSFFPELRRTKSFSASKNEAFPVVLFEPQRKSCDVRVRSTLSNLLTHDNNNKTNKETASEADSKNPASSSKVESKEEEEKEVQKQKHKHEGEENEEEDEIKVVEESNVSEEIVEEEEEGVVIGVDEEGEELKTMKDHIDLDSSSQAKKGKGSFWSAASVFSKKLQKWRQKQKEGKKKQRALPVEKPIGRKFRDTQSEVADYGFGRRSCDTDPRFSLDAGRMSLDVGRMSFDGDPRYSLDEPRASWDGYLIGRTGFPRMPTMLSVVEDAPVVNVARTDTQIPVEEPPNEDESVPGGSLQTKEYYSDSSSRRRKSLDRSNSVKRRENIDELKSVSNISTSGASASASSIVANNVNNGFTVANSKVTPAAAGVGVDYIHGSMRMGSFHDRDDCLSETYEMGASVIGDRKGEKKSRRWSIWGFIHRRGRNKDDDEDRYSRVNGVERSFSESWQDGRGGGGGFGGRVLRSNSSVSWRNAQGIGGGGSFGSLSGRNKNGVVQGNGHGKKGKDEFVLERNRSARYSSSEVDNGLLRFYLTPLRGSRRNGSVKSTSRSNQAHSIARSVLGLY